MPELTPRQRVWGRFMRDLMQWVDRKTKPTGTSVITVRLLIEDGELKSWSRPSGQQWHSAKEPWARGLIGESSSS